MNDDITPDKPTISIVSGHPTDEEIAAVVAVLVAASGHASVGVPPMRDERGWARPAHVRHARPRSWAESRLPR